VARDSAATRDARFARVLIDFLESTDPAEFDFSERDLDMLRERMLKRSKRSR
jgi:hypothetical protein